MGEKLKGKFVGGKEKVIQIFLDSESRYRIEMLAPTRTNM